MKPKDTRDRILKAGLKLFSKKGYLGTTTREIAEKAGVAEVTLFRYFPSKAVLFEETIKSYSFLFTLKGMLPELKEMEYRDALVEIARRFLNKLSERKDLIRIMQAERHLYPSKVKEIYHNFIGEIFKTLASYFKDLQGRKVLMDFNPEFGARAFLGMFFSYFNARELLMRKRYRFSDDNMAIEEFVNIFVNGTLISGNYAQRHR